MFQQRENLIIYREGGVTEGEVPEWVPRGAPWPVRAEAGGSGVCSPSCREARGSPHAQRAVRWYIRGWQDGQFLH